MHFIWVHMELFIFSSQHHILLVQSWTALETSQHKVGMYLCSTSNRVAALLVSIIWVLTGAMLCVCVCVDRHWAAGGLQRGVPPSSEGLSRMEVQEQEAQRRRKWSEGS